MKKWFSKLLILTLGVTALSGCDFFSSGDVKKRGDEDHEVKGLVLKDYSTSVLENSVYEFDGKVFLTYEDSSIADYEVTSECTFSNVDTSKVGNADLKVSYEGSKYIYSKTVRIEVKELVTLDRLEVSNYTTSIKKGSTYVFNGTITAYYSNKTFKDVTKLATIKKLDTSVAGQIPLDISYSEDGKTILKTVEIKVYEARAKLSKIVATGYTTEVDKNDIYTFDGVVTATFEDKTTEIVTNDCEFDYDSSFSTASSGTKSLKIKYTTVYTTSSGAEVSNYKTTTASINVISRLTGLSGEDLVVGVNKISSISLTYIPSDASNKSVTYESNDTSIATVDQNGKVTGVSVGNTTITVTSKFDSSITATINVEVSPVVQDAWTILLYVCGSNLESDYASSNQGAATQDLEEIVSVSGQPDDVNVVVQAGGSSKWSSTFSSVINKDKANRFHLRDQQFVKDSQTAKVNMGLGSTLESFVTWGLQTYPADKIGLILWNHGGAMTGCCQDEQYNDMLTPAEVDEAIVNAKATAGYANKFEFVGYDCCLMQVQDIAGLASKYAKYHIASEESEWGYGWSYDAWLDDLYAGKSTSDILKANVDGFKADTTSAYSSWGDPNDQTLSYLDLSYWDEYEVAWENMATTLSSIITSTSKWGTFETLLNSCQRFGYDSSYGYAFDVFDVGHFFTKIKTNSTYKTNATLMSQIATLESIHSNLVAYEWHGSGSSNAHGLTMFAPVCGYSAKSDYSTSSTPFTVWRNLCISYGDWYY